MMTVAAHAMRKGGRGVFLATLAVYSIVFTAGQFDHHSLSCHVRSRTHCTSCTFGFSSFGVEANTAPSVFRSTEDEQLSLPNLRQPPAPVVTAVTGRSPPA